MTYSVDQSDTVAELYGEQAQPLEAQAIPRGLRGWLVLALVAASVMFYRQLLWYVGVHVSQRVLSAGSAVLLLFALAGTAWSVARSTGPIPSRHGYTGRLLILTAWVVWMTAWGIIRGNFANEVFKEAVGFLILVLLLMLGRYDAVWRAIRKPLIIFFYVAFVAVLLTYRIPGVATDFEGTYELKTKFVGRNLNTIGYFMAGIMQVALLLGAWGMAERGRKDIWRWFMIGALGGYLFTLVLLFEFRSALLNLTAVVGLFVLLSPRVRGRIPVSATMATLLLAAIGLALAAQTDEFGALMERFARGGMFRERISEAQAFFDDMGPLDLLVGRGLGGWYEGPYWAPGLIYAGHRMWTANHFGILAFVLRGGFPLLVFVTTFAIPVILPKLPGWPQNEYNFAALILTPVLLCNIILNPPAFEPDGFFLLIMWGFCFARFSTSPEPQNQSPPSYGDTYYNSEPIHVSPGGYRGS
jgi:hypothetical protein